MSNETTHETFSPKYAMNKIYCSAHFYKYTQRCGYKLDDAKSSILSVVDDNGPLREIMNYAIANNIPIIMFLSKYSSSGEECPNCA